jgi:gamma-butyrobetaine dioxygenase
MKLDVRELRDRLGPRGFFVISRDEADLSELHSPWAFAARLAGSAPRMVERQVIRAVPGGRSFASNDRKTPLHADLQMFLGAPADLQVMACVRQADHGGASILCDMWPIVDAVRLRDQELFDALFSVERRFPFVAGDVTSPTIARFGDRIAFLHAPRALDDDPLSRRIGDLLARAATSKVRLQAGEILVVDNHRVLHGREAFSDPRRELVRFLVWTAEARDVPGAVSNSARPLTSRPASALECTEDDRGLVDEMLRGVSPGALAIKAGVPEPLLYALRDAWFRRASRE